jgi:HSP20 family molecular chaperone IbpA
MSHERKILVGSKIMMEIQLHIEPTPLQLSGEEDIWAGDPLRSSGWRLKRHSTHWRPPTDVYETEAEFVIVVEIAGMRGLDISATYDKGLLSVCGTRSDKGGLKAYHQMEIAYGEFATEVRLPGSIDTEKIEATYSDGFLRVVLPKMEAKSISIDK